MERLKERENDRQRKRERENRKKGNILTGPNVMTYLFCSLGGVIGLFFPAWLRLNNGVMDGGLDRG